ncbi:Probable epoxide hydrolase EphC [Mycobacteroides abscessus subsp. abscessus]|nr:Probable epoxide hydrolase EphC [Mycobacteroides abscessus subsp. abscessus]
MAADCYLTLDLPNVRLRALAWGPQDGPLVICGHGFPDSAHTWRLLGPRLGAEGWRVVAPFTRGYAPSEIPADAEYGLGALMQDVLDIRGPAVRGSGIEYGIDRTGQLARCARTTAVHELVHAVSPASVAAGVVIALAASVVLAAVVAGIRRAYRSAVHR